MKPAESGFALAIGIAFVLAWLLIFSFLNAVKATDFGKCLELKSEADVALCMDNAQLEDVVSELLLLRLKSIQDPENFDREAWLRTMQKLAEIGKQVAIRCARMAEEVGIMDEQARRAYQRACHNDAMQALKGLGLK